jgi:hypothetical protein
MGPSKIKVDIKNVDETSSTKENEKELVQAANVLKALPLTLKWKRCDYNILMLLLLN